ncbi:glyoxalase/bleomycin resistance protein/dioxygenase [Pseudovirgaria hyperparasitica]|uniref:Glyoxalase/bleomycin resistance protein/dioxygenase n=1 Tax=Pseudovirgaria hyperparasitica TaxID=470096 RepID=A0A6A6WE69_9PEZI|nr:glyoxalase/bleomycin resistance protein/dioxygenase [Pseudovirgaria hyperparasitica]KAF2760166.1 glyoxalase/bleomycin resistance protein/dioxygenase [Pseudovirgaria hyperparasitica]
MTPPNPYGTGKLNHIGIKVPSELYEQTVALYLAILTPLGYTKQMDFGVAVGFGIGADGPSDFWVSVAKDASQETRGLHLAFTAETREQVRVWYEAAIGAGGKDNGPPGLRPMYHEDYYGAFVFDPVGNNIEIVDHKPYPKE